MARQIKSMYWNNVPNWVVKAQARSFDKLGFPISQHDATGIQHGVWIDRILNDLDADANILFVDIDCVPLNSGIVDRAFRAAEDGRLFGSAQTANHLPDSELLYAAPSFLCFSKNTWQRLGKVSMSTSAENDAAMALTRRALSDGVAIELLMPTFVCCPKWPLGKEGATGYGTIYDGQVFHLFQSRDNKAYDFAFRYITNCVILGERPNLIELHARMNSISIRARSRLYAFNKRLHKLVRNSPDKMSKAI